MRKRTPSGLKWLLVERATIAGDIQRLHAAQAQIESELEKLQMQLDVLDSTLAFAYSSARPDSAGTIHRHGRYGKRGALKEFIVAAIQNAAPASITTLDVAYSALVAFGLSFATKAEFQAFTKDSIKRQILLLKKEGLVEALHNPKGGLRCGQAVVAGSAHSSCPSRARWPREAARFPADGASGRGATAFHHD